MSQKHQSAPPETERTIVARWARDFVIRNWQSATWSVLWVAAAFYTTDGIVAPVLLLSLALLTVATSQRYVHTGGER